MVDRRRGLGCDSPVKAVVFDLFNTLTVPIDDLEFRSSLKAMAHAVGADSGAFTQVWFDLLPERFDGTFLTSEASVRAICDAIGVPVHAKAISVAMKIHAEQSRRSLRPRADALATLNQLRVLRLRTALISSCSPDIPVLWPTTPFAQTIEEPVFSCVEGLTKPDSAIYLRACERLRVDPRACLYVGDGAHGELSGAASVGMRAVLIKTPEDSVAAYDSERASWRGEVIEALSELPSLITGAEAAATD